jgi:hypothetical protein
MPEENGDRGMVSCACVRAGRTSSVRGRNERTPCVRSDDAVGAQWVAVPVDMRRRPLEFLDSLQGRVVEGPVHARIPVCSEEQGLERGHGGPSNRR